MTLIRPSWRREAAILAWTGVLVCAVGLSVTAAHALGAGSASSGAVTLDPGSFDSGTQFALQFETTQFCPGDAAAGYRWQTFITPRSADPATMTYSSSTPSGDAFTAFLRDNTGSQIKFQNPGLTDGQIAPPSKVTFGGVAFSVLPPGDYWIGIACTKANAQTGIHETEKFWATPVAVEASTGAGANNFTVATVTTSSTTSSSSSSTSSTTSSTTSTTVSSTTTSPTSTTTDPNATTTVVPTSTSTTAPFVVSDQGSGSFGSGTDTGSGSGDNIAFTGPGSGRMAIAWWAALLLITGRIAILLSRRPRVLRSTPR